MILVFPRHSPVIPAKAGIYLVITLYVQKKQEWMERVLHLSGVKERWVPAFAGMTIKNGMTVKGDDNENDQGVTIKPSLTS